MLRMFFRTPMNSAPSKNENFSLTLREFFWEVGLRQSFLVHDRCSKSFAILVHFHQSSP